jgi:hypothetical protein
MVVVVVVVVTRIMNEYGGFCAKKLWVSPVRLNTSQRARNIGTAK